MTHAVLSQDVLIYFHMWCSSQEISAAEGCRRLKMHPSSYARYTKGQAAVPMVMMYKILARSGQTLGIVPIEDHL